MTLAERLAAAGFVRVVWLDTLGVTREYWTRRSIERKP